MSNVGGKEFLMSIWETRCNRPVYHYVLWTDEDDGDGQCRLEKSSRVNFCCVPNVDFDVEKALR